MRRAILIFLILSFGPLRTGAQDAALTVPDLAGLSVPAAEAVLHRLGLAVGALRSIPPDSDTDSQENTIAAQNPLAGTPAASGATVDLTVYRAVNARLIYDDNDLTFVNLGARRLDLADVDFVSVEPAERAVFDAETWNAQLSEGQCGQIWSIGRSASKPIDGCDTIFWRTTGERGRHFWTQSAGIVEFGVFQSGTLLTQCPAAGAGTQDAPLTCDLILGIEYPEELTGYVYFAYTPDVLTIYNQTSDRWMDVRRTVIAREDQVLVDLDTVGLFAAITPQPLRLAPGECLLFARSRDVQPPLPCAVAGIAELADEAVFWGLPFQVTGRDSTPRECAPAAEFELAICVMPR